jgi:hypothetical protein
MMNRIKYFLIPAFYISTVTGCAQINVISIEKLPLAESGNFFHPSVDEAGKKILLTSENYKGLQIFDIEKKELTKITDTDGAGYSPVYSWNGETVLYAENEYIQNRRYSKLSAYDVKSGRIEMVNPPVRSLSIPMVAGDLLFFKTDDQLKSAHLGPAPEKPFKEVFTYIEEKQLYVYQNGQSQILNPFENESYVWPSVSPDSKRILAYAMGKGAFICDLEGKVLAEFGEVEAPVWAGNEFIVGMITRDDGHAVTGSVIVIANASTGKILKMTPEGMIAMYPSVSAVKGKIYFNSPEGDVFVLQYQANR